jgi:hypothetical protein
LFLLIFGRKFACVFISAVDLMSTRPRNGRWIARSTYHICANISNAGWYGKIRHRVNFLLQKSRFLFCSRVPSYCDRVLYSCNEIVGHHPGRSANKLHIQCTSYECVYGVTFSDHLPVRARFEAQVQKI